MKADKNIVYDAAMALYGGAIRIASLKNDKAARMLAGRKETIARLKNSLRPGDRPIWIHAASLGEFEQGRPLIERLRRERPDKKIVLSFFSPSGYEVRKNYSGADVVVYMPGDSRRRMREFIGAMNPEAAIFVKYEIWRNALSELKARKIPAYLISAVFRESQLFFKSYGRFYREWLRMFNGIFVQDSGSRRLLESVGIESKVSGDTRFDRVAQIAAEAKEIPELYAFTRSGEEQRPFTMVFGSSWPADEDVYADWVVKHPEMKTIIAPHEFDSERLARLQERFGEGTVLLSQAKDDPERLRNASTLIIDCFGLLSSAYRYGDAAYVGGGFGTGIHNINEAAAHGIPVLFGPNNGKFLEAQDMKVLGGGVEVVSKDSFDRHASRLLYDRIERETRGKASAEYIAEKCGATDIIMKEIFSNNSK